MQGWSESEGIYYLTSILKTIKLFLRWKSKNLKCLNEKPKMWTESQKLDSIYTYVGKNPGYYI